jgi:neutral ceramidase
VMAEVQAFVLGPVAIVALPGEPMIELAMAIQKASPYPHTIVMGYSNGGGVMYVGMPGELARGGYGADRVAHGTDECGAFLVDTASRLLREIASRPAEVIKPKP